MLLHNKKIAIIGGGPGGLTLARLLQLKGVEVKVYERDVDRNARLQGGALDLHTESGLAALEKAGLMDEFKQHYRPGAELIRIVDSQAKVCYDEHGKGKTGSFGDKHHRPEIDRGSLRDILLDSLKPDTVVWNSHIESVEPIGAAWKIVFQNGETTIADAVVGADGVNSKIRPFVTDIKPIWTGITMVEGSIEDAKKTAPNIHKLLKSGKIFAANNERMLIVSSKGNGSFGFAVSCKTAEAWSKESRLDFTDNKQVLAWFKKEFSGWGSVWDELFASETTLFIPRPQYCMPLDQHWEAKPNITIIGDAAHWMPPFAGEGVNMAMLDALQLSESLTSEKFATTQVAIANYEKQMFIRFAQIGRETLYNTEWMHAPNALRDMLMMFGGNIFKQVIFIARMWWKTKLIPPLRSVAGRPANPGALT
jgi:2-polyprenyl-6-methoxyphenol hydroxylase-like FAD-dependent oxidoreductase